MDMQESERLLREHRSTVLPLRDELKEIIGIELETYSVSYFVDEAMKLNHNRIDTEHLLLGLLREGGIARRVLRELNVNLEDLEIEVKAMSNGPCISTDVAQLLGFTDAAKQVLHYAAGEAQKVKSDYVRSEYILLGLIQEKNGIVAKTLTNFGVTLERVRGLLDPRPTLKLQHRTWQLNLNDVDKAIRDLVYLLNEAPFLDTSSSCSGHPDYYRTLYRTIVVDKDIEWFGSDSGAAIYNKKSRDWITFTVDDGLASNRITCIAKDTKEIWFGTFDAGMMKYDKESKTFSAYTRKEGLAHNCVLSLTVDGNYLWIGTQQGLSRFDKTNNTWTTYTAHQDSEDI